MKLPHFNFNVSIPAKNFDEEVIGHILSVWVKSEVLQEQLCEVIAHLKNEPVDEVIERYNAIEGEKRVEYSKYLLRKYPQ